MTRPCSNSSPNGHHSRTCQACPGAAVPASSSLAFSGGGGGGVRLFGVRLTDGSIMKKSASMGNLSHSYHSPSSSAAASPSPSSPSAAAGGSAAADPGHLPDEYLSDDPNHASCSSNRRAERKKGTPWTAEEHRLFLIGLQKLGKGDWRGIARNFVVSRTPTQVASHAQKYFIRQSNTSRRKRRSSLFDMVPDSVTDFQPVYEEQVLLPPSQLSQETINANSLPSLDLSLSTEANEPEPMEESSSTEIPVEDFKGQEQEKQPQPIADLSESQPSLQPPAVVPMIYPAFVPMEYQFWPENPASHSEDTADLGDSSSSHHQHQVFKPVPIVPKEPVNVDELVGMSDKLKLVEAQPGHLNPPQLSLNLLGAPSRQSAFHVSAPLNGSELK